MDNNGKKRFEISLFFSGLSLGVGWGSHFEDTRWENEVKFYIREDLFDSGLIKGITNFLIPSAFSAWKTKEIAHETFYGCGIFGLYVDIPKVKTTCRLLQR